METQEFAPVLYHKDAHRVSRIILDSPAMTGQMIALDGGEHLVSTSAP